MGTTRTERRRIQVTQTLSFRYSNSSVWLSKPTKTHRGKPHTSAHQETFKTKRKEKPEQPSVEVQLRQIRLPNISVIAPKSSTIFCRGRWLKCFLPGLGEEGGAELLVVYYEARGTNNTQTRTYNTPQRLLQHVKRNLRHP